MLHRPFSYLVPASRFPRRIDVWDRDGKPVRTIADQPLQEEIPIAYGSVATGPRSFTWRGDVPATLVWAEAQDGGDARAEAEVRDRIFMLPSPFDGEPARLAETALRYSGITWGNDDLALMSEWWWKTRQVRTSILQPGVAGAKPEVLWDRSWEDRYNAPGSPVTRPAPNGRYLLMTANKGKTLFLIGEGASPEGNRPFFDELDLGTKETRRLWRSEAPYYERPVTPLDDEARRILTRRESKQEPPNYFLRDLKVDELVQLTDFPHPTPQLEGLSKELIEYVREDGVRLNATLYLPPRSRRRRRAAAAADVGVPRGVQERRCGRAGHRLTLPFRPGRLVVTAAVPVEGVRGPGRSQHAHHRRGGRGAQRYLRRSAGRERKGGSGRGRAPGRHRPPIGSPLAATPTAHS